MIKLETENGRDWRGFARLLEIISFIDELDQRPREEVRKALDGFCELPLNAGQTLSLEEVVFWAGISTGVQFMRQAEEEDNVDPVTVEKMLVFSSIFAHSLKSAIVDLALGEIESSAHPSWIKLRDRLRH
ncbi:MAG TPA: hypothetical protein VFB00_02620 [Terriglobales bacterium]|nr:hypothetical protein [Terriglobales bacterium]